MSSVVFRLRAEEQARLDMLLERRCVSSRDKLLHKLLEEAVRNQKRKDLYMEMSNGG